MTFQTFTGLDIIINGEDFDNSFGQNSNVAKVEKDAAGDKKEIIVTVRKLL